LIALLGVLKLLSHLQRLLNDAGEHRTSAEKEFRDLTATVDQETSSLLDR
jgi:hypothetical protein